MVFMYNLISNTCSYSYPIRMDAYFVCVLSILLRGKIHKRVHTPLHIPNSMIAYIIVGQWKSIIMRCSPSYFISNSEILKKYIILYLYNEPLYLAHLRSMSGPYSLFNLIELHAFYLGHH